MTKELDKIAKKYPSLHKDWVLLRNQVKEKEFNIFFPAKYGNNNVMEIGIGDGIFTELLALNFSNVIAVDNSQESIRFVKNRLKNYKNIIYINNSVERLEFSGKIDNIVMSHILEHVQNPVKALKNVKKIMHENTILYISVPNAFSLHRQVGVVMGLLASENQLIESDIKLGHKRVYDKITLFKDIFKSKLKIIKWGGILLKPFSNAQMEKFCNLSMINGFISIGDKYPEICGELYAITKKE